MDAQLGQNAGRRGHWVNLLPPLTCQVTYDPALPFFPDTNSWGLSFLNTSAHHPLSSLRSATTFLLDLNISTGQCLATVLTDFVSPALNLPPTESLESPFWHHLGHITIGLKHLMVPKFMSLAPRQACPTWPPLRSCLPPDILPWKPHALSWPPAFACAELSTWHSLLWK